ncbi:MAG TPA: DUF2244 domain-containing protein [Alphaproteobacteria bacterium]|nr:DUF2244 domain-containing protein [Alphaproteobacteria bacterium]
MNRSPDCTLPDAAQPLFFDAVLTPHRSLSPHGFWILMALICAASFLAGIFFVLHGAWPVTGFFGLDVLLLYIAFKASYRSARLRETVKLSAEALVVERVGLSGRRSSWTFQPYWLRIEIDDPPDHGSQLTLSSHGRSLAIGSFLSPEERLEVAQALRAALLRWRDHGREAAVPSVRETSRAV